MSTPTEIPAVASLRRIIAYEITRWDMFVNFITVILRNRILQMFSLFVLICSGWLVLAPGFGDYSPSHFMFNVFIYLLSFLGIMAVFQCVLGFANAYIPKHRGVLGRHVLEITEQGLIERTDCNETLHRWPSVCRVLSLGGYLYIYVSDNNSHQVPKRQFLPEELKNFEADLRSYARRIVS